MKERSFWKYSGAGNDFVVLDDGAGAPAPSTDEIREICDRRFGVGADGLMRLGEDDTADFRMIYYNADGSRGEMCGNGARCLTHFARLRRGIGPEGMIQAEDGLHRYRCERDRIWVEILSDGEIIAFAGHDVRGGFLQVGVPHLVLPVDSFENLSIATLSMTLNTDPSFPRGTNVNFLRRTANGFQVRTWERGVNAETLACGTGATACGIYAHHTWGSSWPLSMDFPGGRLILDEKENGLWLSGPTQLVFRGFWTGEPARFTNNTEG